MSRELGGTATRIVLFVSIHFLPNIADSTKAYTSFIMDLNALGGSLPEQVVALAWQVWGISDVALGPVKEILQKQYRQDQDNQPCYIILEWKR